MPILTVILVIVLAGLLLWVVERFIPMDAAIKTILRVVVVIVLIIWILKISGILPSLNNVRI